MVHPVARGVAGILGAQARASNQPDGNMGQIMYAVTDAPRWWGCLR
jgi:hypothetical protein